MTSSAILGRKIRVALVGCGRIAVNHFDAIQQYPQDLILTDICDSDPLALSVAAARTGARPHRSLRDLLLTTDADVIVLTTPSGLHPVQAIEVAKSGRHVITEKPMATRWADGLEMVRECDAAGVRLFVVKQNRRNSTLRLLKQALIEGRFGRLYSISMNVFWSRPQSYYDSASWRGTWEWDGGALMNQASHYVDLLQWLFGPIESVACFAATLGRRIDTEDTAVATLRWRSGALGTLNVTMLTFPKNFEGAITVLGEFGTVRIGGVAVNEIQHWAFADPRESDSAVLQASYETTSVYGKGHIGYYENVIAALRGHEAPETDGREGLKSLELLTALYRSARDGHRVTLPLEL